ncbi:hypothetical protein WJX72_000498 [[Myrmecia] bisecta]|uniref:Tf2-1-like SH3-like domain-containing protein n=1 Tax=[Myrmecia] bisecta TaxID=41462 RepID=A0AAW1QNN2_9CHLO
MNRTLEEMLRHYCGEPHIQSQWEDLLPLAEFSYNSTPQTSTGHSPFYLNYGQDPLTPATLAISEITPSLQVPVEDEWLIKLNQALAAPQESIKRATDAQAAYADRHRRDITLKPGDKVYIEARALPPNKCGSKISPLRRGPYEVLDAVGPVAYRVKIPGKWRIHNVFHVSQLTLLTPQRPNIRDRVPDRIVTFGSGKQRPFLVEFADGSAYDTDWITKSDLMRLAPHLYASFVRSLAMDPMRYIQ